MNGWVQDPTLGRFLSPDPFVQNPTHSQNYDRMAYTVNNPLAYTDPSGFIRKTVSRGVRGVGRAIRSAAKGFGDVLLATASVVKVVPGGVEGGFNPWLFAAAVAYNFAKRDAEKRSRRRGGAFNETGNVSSGGSQMLASRPFDRQVDQAARRQHERRQQQRRLEAHAEFSRELAEGFSGLNAPGGENATFGDPDAVAVAWADIAQPITDRFAEFRFEATARILSSEAGYTWGAPLPGHIMGDMAEPHRAPHLPGWSEYAHIHTHSHSNAFSEDDYRYGITRGRSQYLSTPNGSVQVWEYRRYRESLATSPGGQSSEHVRVVRGPKYD